MVTSKNIKNMQNMTQTLWNLYADDVNKWLYATPVNITKSGKRRFSLRDSILEIRYKIAKVLLSLANKVSWRAYDDEFYQY